MSEYNFNNMTASEIENIKVSKEKELQSARNNLHEVELQELELAKEIVILQGKRKDLQIAISKAKHIVSILKVNIDILTTYFWKAKDGR